jgi:hypothetical protein
MYFVQFLLRSDRKQLVISGAGTRPTAPNRRPASALGHDDDIEPLLDELEDRLDPGRYEGQAAPAVVEDTEERRAHRDGAGAFLPAWKREAN